MDVYNNEIKSCKLGNKPNDFCKVTEEDDTDDIVFLDVPMGAAPTAGRSQNWLSMPFQHKLRCTMKKGYSGILVVRTRIPLPYHLNESNINNLDPVQNAQDYFMKEMICEKNGGRGSYQT